MPRYCRSSASNALSRWLMRVGLAAGLGLAAASAGLAQEKQDHGFAGKMSSEQVEKLVDLWHQHFSGAHDLLDRRSAFEDMMADTPEPTRVQTRHVDADGVAADLILPARLHYSPGSRAILFVHGGGFYGGSLRTHRNAAAALAKAASADVLLVDYRRVPEAAYPMQIQDTLTAYRWLLVSGYRSENIAIVGDSVGGNLAIEAVLRQMQARKPLPASVVLMSPVTDLAVTGASIDEYADRDPLISRAYLELLGKAYLGGVAPDDPQASPLYADMKGFPPLLIQVGSREALLDDSLRLARKAGQADVAVTLEIWPGMVHQWQLFPFWIRDGRRSNDNAAAFIESHFADH